MKMDMSNINIKEILGKLSVLKSNLSLSASIIITLVAMLLFIPAKILGGKLENTVKQESLGKGTQIKTAKEQAVSKDQWKELAKYEAAYEKDANEIAILAMRSTQRELLSYDMFPSPKDKSSGIFKAFGERYQAAIDGEINRINAKDCPTQEELSQGMANASVTSSMGGGYRGYSATSSRQPRGSEFDYYQGYQGGGLGSNTVMDTIRDEICLSRAKSISAYANPVDLAGYEFWEQYKYDVKPEDAIQDCWYYQLGYWVIEDVFSTIIAMNSGSAQVFTSPVKRLMYVRFGEDSGDARTSGAAVYDMVRSYTTAAGRPAMDRPSYTNNVNVNVNMTGYNVGMTGYSDAPHTNRLGDEDIDVMHFNFAVIIEAGSVLPFMKELCSIKKHKFKGFFDELPAVETFAHNQITILRSAFYAVERSDVLHDRYRYGQNAVVELEFTCEYIFNKKAYDAVKPKEVKVQKDPMEQPAAQEPYRTDRGLEDLDSYPR
jgi:hypothetical protein